MEVRAGSAEVQPVDQHRDLTKQTEAVPPRIQRGMALLIESYQYALSLERHVWDFAVANALRSPR